MVAYLLCRFSWWRDLLPAISARPEGMSFLNPFDTSGLRDFNVFYVVSGVLGLFFNRMLWGGTGYQSAAKDAHEAKMGAVLGTWRSGFSAIMFTLIAALAYAWFNHSRFAEASHSTGAALAATAYADVTLSAGAGPDGEADEIAAAFIFVYKNIFRNIHKRKLYLARIPDVIIDYCNSHTFLSPCRTFELLYHRKLRLYQKVHTKRDFVHEMHSCFSRSSYRQKFRLKNFDLWLSGL